MNKRIIGIGVIILIVALPISIYTTTSYVPYGNSPAAAGLVQEKTTQPYLTDGLILAAIALIIIVVGIVIPSSKRGRTSEQSAAAIAAEEETEGGAGASRNDQPKAPGYPSSSSALPHSVVLADLDV
jgi:hypothetical protein